MAELRANQLRRKIKLNSRKKSKKLDEIIGQEKAIEAIKLGIGINSPGYNIFITGTQGSGKHTIADKILKENPKKDFSAYDLVYVNNFEDSDKPTLLELKAGQGKKLKTQLEKAIEKIKNEREKKLDSTEYLLEKTKIHQKYHSKINKIEEKISDLFMNIPELSEIIEDETEIEPTSMTMISMSTMMDASSEEDNYKPDKEGSAAQTKGPKLSPAQLKKILAPANYVLEKEVLKLSRLKKRLNKLETKSEKEQEELKKTVLKQITKPELAKLKKQFTSKKIKTYLNQVEQHIIENLDEILDKIEPELQEEHGNEMNFKNIEYQVNLFLDNSKTKRKPIIKVENPTYDKVFGTIELEGPMIGHVSTDFTKIKPGKIHEALGGYLILDFTNLSDPDLYHELISTLKSGKITAHTPSSPFMADLPFKPEELNADLKVIILGSEEMYRSLKYHDPDFSEVFKIHAELAEEIKLTEDVIEQYARAISAIRKKHKLKKISKTGKEAIIEYAIRQTEDKRKATLIFKEIEELTIEANYHTKEKKQISRENVNDALTAKRKRANSLEEILSEMVEDGSIKIDIKGRKIGQINGLVVYDVGAYSFGQAARISAVTSAGKEGITHIEREIKQSGKIHDKGVLELTGYLKKEFAQEKPLSLDASVTFEQNYGEVDGDSATLAETYAIMSSIAKIPLKQGIAITGSMDQFGEAQAIGGVNVKIEGFYDHCIKSGLTGEQGVIIPHSNVQNLMLRQDVVDSVTKKDFHIYSIKHFKEGWKYIAERNAGTIKEKGSIYWEVNEDLIRKANLAKENTDS